jgi:hypothetical protein
LSNCTANWRCSRVLKLILLRETVVILPRSPVSCFLGRLLKLSQAILH